MRRTRVVLIVVGGLAAAAGGCKEGDPGSARISEAELNLRAIGKMAGDAYREDGRFPVATVGLTPSQSCCDFPRHRCPATRDDWRGVPAWDALGFEMTEPHFYRYAYTGTERSFEVTAEGDLDCDGTSVTWVLRGSVEGGRPTTKLLRPTNRD